MVAPNAMTIKWLSCIWNTDAYLFMQHQGQALVRQDTTLNPHYYKSLGPEAYALNHSGWDASFPVLPINMC